MLRSSPSPQGGSDPAAMTRSRRRDGDGWVLDGAKRWIGLASLADVAVVWAASRTLGRVRKGAQAIRGFLVPTSTPGFTATPIDGKLAMRASVQCDIALDGVRVDADAILPGASRALGALRLPQRGALRHRLGRDGRRPLVPRGGARALGEPRGCSAGRSGRTS